MSHEHGTECERLHEMLQSLVARLDVSAVNALAEGTVVAPSLDNFAHSASSPDGTSLELEIASVRHALEVMSCGR